jgi:hypothetical protein
MNFIDRTIPEINVHIDSTVMADDQEVQMTYLSRRLSMLVTLSTIRDLPPNWGRPQKSKLEKWATALRGIVRGWQGLYSTLAGIHSIRKSTSRGSASSSL